MGWEVASVIVNSVLAIATVAIIFLNYRQVKASSRQADAGQDQVFELRKQVEANQQQLRVSRDQLIEIREQAKQQVRFSEEQLLHAQTQIQEQARISEEQLEQSRRQIQETLDASHRPFLYPTSPLPLQESYDERSFDFQGPDLDRETALQKMLSLTLKNGGAGIALNIRALIVEPHEATREMLGLSPSDPMSPGISTQRLPRLSSVILDTALPPGDYDTEQYKKGPFVVAWDTTLDGDPRNTLAAPPSPSTEHPYHIVARLTIFQDDIFGHTYASQFDLSDRGRWIFHCSGRVPLGSEALKCLQPKP